MKFLMKLRRRKGFTLVELVIVIAILALLLGCVAAFSTPVRQMVEATASSTDAITANKIIGDYIENRLAFADRIDIVYAVDPATGAVNTDISDSFTGVQNLLSDANSNASEKSGVIVFHYVPDTNEPLNSSYRLYDIPITTSGSYSATMFNGTELNGEVFADAFYANSQNLMLAPTEVTSNKVRKSYYMTIDIIPYDCDDDYPAYITADVMDDYYKHLSDPALYPTNPLDALEVQKSGAVESISFELQNMEVATGKWNAKTPSGALGEDIMIFYHIPHF